MKRLFLAIALLPVVAFGQTTPPNQLIRRYGAAMQDTMDAARYVRRTVPVSGMQTVINKIRDCYSTTELPAFKCIDLDIAAMLYDTHAGKAMGLSGPTEEFFDHSNFVDRIRSAYPAGQYSDQQIQDDISIAGYYAELGLVEGHKQP